MKRVLVLLGAAALGGGCEKVTEVSSTDTRRLATCDVAPRLDAGSDERFRNAPVPRFAAGTPDDWKVLPADDMKLLRYRFGPSGKGEAWVSASGGTVEANVNRWLAQFGAAPLDGAAIQALPKVSILGTTGVVVKAEGEYNDGRNAPEPGYGLAGVLAEVGGEIITVKMVAPAAEVRFNFAGLEALLKSLREIR